MARQECSDAVVSLGIFRCEKAMRLQGGVNDSCDICCFMTFQKCFV